jgi:ABC-2 type transport system permease protein
VLALVLALAGILYHSTKNVYGAAIVAVMGAGAAIIVFFVNRLVFDGIIGRLFTWLSVFSRFNNLTRGILNLSDIVFYLTFALIFIYLTVNVIEKRRWR